MIPDNVTVIVKAPNQQIEDQHIECQTSWTIRQLKGHLSEVYPSKPKTEEQKIIYSGQLLDDNSILKDVLRNYKFPIPHTMHLVCSSKNNMDPPEPNTDGLRNRNNATANQTSPPEMRQNDQNHTVEMQNYLSSLANNYGRVLPYQNSNFNDRYLPMQQAYMQYMQQYANLWQAYAMNALPAEEVVQPPPPPPPQAAEAAEEPRDWLDHLYMGSRIAVLISLLYFYGSPGRLLLILLLAVLGHLYQTGFFRELLLNADDNLEQNINQANQPEQGADQAAPAAQDTSDSNQNPPDDHQSLLALTWTLFTAFFASLIPEAN